MKKNIPETTNKNPSKISVTERHFEFHASPFPDPAILEAYNRINEGFAERILSLVESETSHRQALEIRSLDAEINNINHQHIEIRIGQILGFLIGIVSIAGGTYAALNGAQWAGGFIGSAGVAGLVSVFVMGRTLKPE